MEYLAELINLENEWRGIKISGGEYAKAIIVTPESKERKRSEIISFRDRLMKSNLIGEEKERRLREIRENLSYLEESTSESALKRSDDSQLLTGILIGGLVAVLGMYLMDQMKNYVKEGISEGVLNGIYSELQKQQI
ncbi:MAG TPA: hypothetical protein VJ343_03310 [archaeon]|nr:hypothetical protein [archaeon]